VTVESRSLSAQDLAALTGGRLVGSPDARVRRVAPLDRAGPEDLSFLASRRYVGQLAESGAAVVLVASALATTPGGPACRVVVPDPHAALIAVLEALYPPPVWRPGVHATAIIGRGAVWEDPVAIGPYVVLGDGVRLGRNVRLDAGCVLGDGVEMGDDVHCYPQVVCYSGTRIGNRVIVHAGARLGSDGFGYVPGSAGTPHRKIPQVGRCVISDDAEIGANTTIDRGSIDDTLIGAGTKIDNLVQIAHNVHIGARCLIAALAGIAGSTQVEDDVLLGGQAGVSDHLVIGRGARLLVQAGVIGDIAPGATVSGYPAREHRTVLRAQAALARLTEILGDLETLLDASREAEP
jgi:UDP-3-O-[3-hydroxymyristoyl] glucosamine N-acyltransferase